MYKANKIIITDAGEFAEMRLSIRIPKPLWRALNTIANNMHDTGTPVRCPVFGKDPPAIASVIRAIIMDAHVQSFSRIGSTTLLSVRSLVEGYIAAGYGQYSAVPIPPSDRGDDAGASDDQPDADDPENAANHD